MLKGVKDWFTGRKSASRKPVVLLSSGWYSSERCECVFIAHHYDEPIAWGRTRDEALAHAWTVCNGDHALYVCIATRPIWFPAGELLGTLSMMNLGLVPRPAQRMVA